SVGATGGTIVPARGTAKEEDVKFFGYPLVPEKDMLLILSGADRTGRILEAINSLPILSKPGIGIAFCVDVERFMVFGAPQNNIF
ncbi:MAG: P-II family nitrogen regulator, partial [Spirochaetales bacterium]|nr:P-II family nitrogen regulator [Spirochaetales bacterium]